MPQAVIAPIALGLTAISTVAAGVASGNAASYQAQVAANNAETARNNQRQAASAAAAQAEQSGLKERAKLGSIRAAIAANGLDVNTGSPADVQTGQRQIGALDTETVAHNAALQVYGYGSQAGNFDAQSKLDSAEAGFAPIAGLLKGAGQFASGYGDAFGGGGSGGSGGLGVDEDFSTVDGSNFSSLVSGTPSVGSSFNWMMSPGNSMEPP